VFQMEPGPKGESRRSRHGSARADAAARKDLNCRYLPHATRHHRTKTVRS
jgi:hypothetical protein